MLACSAPTRQLPPPACQASGRRAACNPRRLRGAGSSFPGGRDPPGSSPRAFCFRAAQVFSSRRSERLQLPGGPSEELATAPPPALGAGTPAETMAPASAMGLGEPRDALRLQASPHSWTSCTPESQHRQRHLTSGMRQGPEIISGKPHAGSRGSDPQVRLQGGDSRKSHQGNISSGHHLVTQPAGTDQGTEG